MKSFRHLLGRASIALALFTALVAVAHAVGADHPTVGFLYALLITKGGAVLAVAYPVANVTTYSDALSDTAKAAQELWVRTALFGADKMYQVNPFGDNMTGLPGSKKAIIRVVETQKVAGTTVNIPLRPGFGGPGVAGGGTRSGAEQKIRFGNMQVKIGKYWYGAAYQQTTKDQTMTGDTFDQVINQGLMEEHARKRSNDHLMRVIQATATAKGAANLVFADGVGSIAALKTVNTVTAALLSKLNGELPSRGALPMSTSKDAQGLSNSEHFMFLGTSTILSPLKTDQSYLDAITRAQDRGANNSRFTGAFADYDGMGIYRWNLMDAAIEGPIGCPLTPRARLGTAVTAAGAATVLQGGGFLYNAANPNRPTYFEHFPGAPYQYYNGDLIAAETASTKYVLILDGAGGFGVFPYTTSDGTLITISGAGLAVGPAGGRVTNFPQGSLVLPCNVLGTPWGYGLAFGAELLACGVGSINGSPTPEGAQMGRKTEEIRNHGEDIAMGLEGVWGNQVVSRIDGLYPNFLLSPVAIAANGAPVIT